MASRFWVGGTGTWDAAATTNWSATTGGAAGASAPTAADDVFLDAGSGVGTVTIAAGAIGRNLDCTGYTGTLTHPTGVTWTLNGPLFKLVPGMTYNSTGTATLNIGAPAQTTLVTTAGKTLSWFGVNGAGSVVQFQDAFTSNGTIVLNQGTIDTNGQTCSWSVFQSNTSSTRVITLGASSITLTGAGTVWNVTSVGLTFTANTATVTLSTANATFFTSSFNYNGMSLVLPGGGVISGPSGGLTFNNLTRTGAASRTDVMNVTGTTIICTGTFTANGNSVTNRLSVASSQLGTARTIQAAAVSLTNVDFTDITGAGVAAPFTGTSLGDAGGNSGITFTAAATQTWLTTGAGNWSDVTKWTSRVPLPQDDVIINQAFVATPTITMDMPRSCRNLDFTGTTGNPTINVSVVTSIFGNLTVAAGVNGFTGTNFTFAGRGAQTITMAGRTFAQNVILNTTGTYTQQDNFVAGGNTGLQVAYGTWDANGFNVTSKTLSLGGTNPRTIKFGSGTWTLNGDGVVVPQIVQGGGANLTLVPGTGTIVMSDTGNTAKQFVGPTTAPTGNWPNLTITGGGTGSITFSASNTFGVFTVTGPKTIIITNSTTQTVTGFSAMGSAGNLVTFQSSTPGTFWSISKAGSYVSADWLSLTDSHAVGGAQFFAGANSTNVSGNTGWIFTGPAFSDVAGVTGGGSATRTTSKGGQGFVTSTLGGTTTATGRHGSTRAVTSTGGGQLALAVRKGGRAALATTGGGTTPVASRKASATAAVCTGNGVMVAVHPTTLPCVGTLTLAVDVVGTTSEGY